MNWRSTARGLFPYLAAAIAGFLLAYLVLFLFAFRAPVVPEDKALPDVTGMRFEAARTKLQSLGFDGEPGETRYDMRAPKMTVLAQNPAAGTRQPAGTRVALALSAGTRAGDVPALIGMAKEAATLALQNAGYQVGDISEQESARPRGEVIATNPVAGASVMPGDRIALIVSRGPSFVNLPDLVGHTYEDAVATLTQLGLQPGPLQVDTTSAEPHNRVVGQVPEAGRRVSTSTRVILTVSGQP